MASEQMRVFAEAMRANRGSTPPDRSVQQQRDDMEAMLAGMLGDTGLPADVSQTPVDAHGVPARWITTPGAAVDRVLLYFHGGGYVMGSVDSHQELMQRLSRASGWSVLGVDYRLAPEHPWPAAVDDAEAAISWLRQTRPQATIALGGDSAGGGLALALLLRLKAKGLPLPAGAVLFSPWTDLTASQDSHHSRAEADPMVSMDLLRDMVVHYAAGADPGQPEISPLFGDLTGLPPLLVQVGADEVLLDDARLLAQRAEAAGVAVTSRVWDGAFHVFQIMPALPESGEAIADVVDFLSRTVVPAGARAAEHSS